MPDYPGPLKHELFDAGPLAQALDDAQSGGSSRTGVTGCKLLKWGITEITLSCAGKESISYKNPTHPPVPGGMANRFYFAPLSEKVRVAWKLKNASQATTLTLELYSAGNPAPIWSRTLDSGGAQGLKLPKDWDGSFPGGEWSGFPDHLVTVEHSPYKLKATAGANHEDDLEVRWTYFDVLIEKIELTWGGRARIPAGNRADIGALYLVQTQADEQAINDALVLQRRGDGTLDPGDTYDVNLRCNQFTDWMHNMTDGHLQRRSTLWLNHEKQWGDGPRIPLVAKIYVAKAAGGGVHGGTTAKALGGSKFLWDWESRDEIAGLAVAGHGPKVTAFLTGSLDYLRNDGNSPPGSTNCHADHGGKRGAGQRVFGPPLVASAGSTACGTRKWATQEQAILTGADAGKVGVLFQPSRIALDTYIVSVYAPPDICAGGPAALDTADAATTLRISYPSLPKAQSGTFEMLHQIRIRYVRKSAAVTPAILVSIAQEYRRAGVVIDWGTAGERAQDEVTLAANFDAWCTQSLQNPDAKARGSLEPQFGPHGNRDWFEPNDQLRAGTGVDTSFGFIVQSWELVTRHILATCIREYVQKARTFNGPKQKYNKWLAITGNIAANDHEFLLPFYNGLKKKKKDLIDALFSNRRDAADFPPKGDYVANMENAGVSVTRLIAEQLLLQINQHGMLILHVESPVAYRRTDGAIDIPASATGGLSPSTSVKWQGRGSVHLVFLPQIPSNDPNAKYHVPVTGVITHEAGHNLYLCHAPAALVDQNGRPQPEAPGAQDYAHDDDDLLCLMNYDERSDHLCGYCNLKLRGWGTVEVGGTSTSPGPIDGGLVKLWNNAARNRNP